MELLELFDLVEIHRTSKIVTFSKCPQMASRLMSHLRFIISSIKNDNSALIFGM